MRKVFAQTFAAALLSFGISSAAIIDFTTNFAPEAVGATGTGTGLIRFDTTAQTLAIAVSWSGLSGNTTVAHIHCCTATPRTGTASVVITPGTLPGFPPDVTAGTYSVVLDLTLTSTYAAAFLNGPGGGTAAGASAAILQASREGRSYFNIHSSTFGGGEIRDFLQETPEPGTLCLAGLALAGLLAFRRYQAL